MIKKVIRLGVCISRAPALCLDPGPGHQLPICIYRPWPPICIYRPWPQIFIYLPWPPICIYRPWPPPYVYRPWTPPCVYPKFAFTGSPRGLSLHIATLSPQFVFTGPGLRFIRTQAAKLVYPQWC